MKKNTFQSPAIFKVCTKTIGPVTHRKCWTAMFFLFGFQFSYASHEKNPFREMSRIKITFAPHISLSMRPLRKYRSE